jgi:hypothetical protein
MVLGNISNEKMTYDIACSITANGRRFKVDYNLVIDHAPVEGLTFHPDVLNNVSTGGRRPHHGHNRGRWSDNDDELWWGGRDFDCQWAGDSGKEAPGSAWLPKDKRKKKDKDDEAAADDLQLTAMVIEDVQARLDEALGLLKDTKDVLARVGLNPSTGAVFKLEKALVDIYKILQPLYISQ